MKAVTGGEDTTATATGTEEITGVAHHTEGIEENVTTEEEGDIIDAQICLGHLSAKPAIYSILIPI